MRLVDDVFALCAKLASTGWQDLFEVHGLNISAKSPAELQKRLLSDKLEIQRSQSGFEDFGYEGTRGIEPGCPARSLFYHALASPNVLRTADGRQLDYFPSLAELELVENFVFGVQPPTLEQLVQRSGGLEMAVVMFAYEYRPASQTCHQIHADSVFSRTGISRVGTEQPLYDVRLRGFLPEVEADPFAIRVCPARYAPFLALRRPGDESESVPMSFQPAKPVANQKRLRDKKSDAQRDFWVPLHKLFAGRECIAGANLKLEYRCEHWNEKIFRVHQGLKGKRPARKDPYAFSEGLAEFGDARKFGEGLVVPVPHPRLIEPALLPSGVGASYLVPRRKRLRYASFSPPQPAGRVLARPEFVHARTKVVNPGLGEQWVNLNEKTPNILARVAKGGYHALHYKDFSGDGWVAVEVEGLKLAGRKNSQALAAYSLVTAPDFFPTCDQRELTEWAESSAVPESLRNNIWGIAPDSLADERLPGNLQLPASPFNPSEEGMTALVPLAGFVTQRRARPAPADALRHSHLPDDAAGVFDPGWDISHDSLFRKGRRIEHLAAYGLGSPFPEDVKLCAALSSFWPAVAPDSARNTEPNPNLGLSATVIPMTDEELGQVGELAWDGIPGPRIVEVDGEELVEYASFQHVDYVRTALAARFTMRLTARVQPTEYKNRVLAMAFVYRALQENRTDWTVLSFRKVVHGDPELERAQLDTSQILHASVFRFELYRRGKILNVAHDFTKKHVRMRDRRLFFVDPVNRRVLTKNRLSHIWGRCVLNL